MTELEKFKIWADEHLGQGYSLDMEDGSFVDRVTRWAFVAYKAGLKDGNATVIGKIVSAYGDPEAFGERDIKIDYDIQKLPYNTEIYIMKEIK